MLSCERIIALVFALGLLVRRRVAAARRHMRQAYEAALAGFTKD